MKEIAVQDRRKLRKVDITGQKYGRLLVLHEAGRDKGGKITWECLCDCGKHTIVAGWCLRSGVVKSCGCLRDEKLAAMARSKNDPTRYYKQPWYKSYESMMRRCYCEKDIGYKNYGGRGIKVCDEWHDVACFARWVEKSGYQKGLTIDRIDTNKNYEPSNCRWANMQIQSNNRRNTIYLTYQGETHSIADWARLLNCKLSTLHSRYYRGWSAAEILGPQITGKG